MEPPPPALLHPPAAGVAALPGGGGQMSTLSSDALTVVLRFLYADDLQHVAAACKHLRSACAAHDTLVTSETRPLVPADVPRLCKLFPEARTVSLGDCSHTVALLAIEAATKERPHLQHLSLLRVLMLSDALSQLVERAPPLETLRLNGACFFDPIAVDMLAAAQTSLCTLELGHCRGLDDDQLETVLIKCRRLKRLHVPGASMLQRPPITLANKGLEVLDLGKCSRLTGFRGDGDEFPTLAEELAGGGVDPPLGHDLSVSSAGMSAADVSAVSTDTATGKPRAALMPSLREVVLSGCSLLTDEALDYIVGIAPALESLDCRGSDGLTRPTLEHEALRHVDLTLCTSMEQATVRCPLLRTLDIGIVPALRVLEVTAPELCVLDLAMTQVTQVTLTARGLRALHLEGCSRLTHVDVIIPFGCRVTAAGVPEAGRAALDDVLGAAGDPDDVPA